MVSKHIEFGQGNHAGLAAIAAEEMDADWDKVKVVQAPANAGAYANLGMGVQGTGGSSAISNSWPQLRAVVRPLYVRLGILPEVAAGIQSAAQLTVPPEG